MVKEFMKFPDASITSVEGIGSFFEEEIEKIEKFTGYELFC